MTSPSTTATTTLTTVTADERDVVVRGVRLHLREVGDRQAPPVLFLHGIMGHRRDWDVLIDQLAASWRVIAVDQRGHGRSEWTHSYRVAEMADDAIALIERVTLAPVSIVGHSMGAMVALIVAARRPDLVDRIALIDIVPDSLTTEFARGMPDMFEAMAHSSYATVDEATAEWQTGNPLARPDLLRNYGAHALVAGPNDRLRWGFDALGLRAFMDGVTPSELWAAIDDVTCPSLVIRGEQSPVTTDDEVAEVARRLGDAQVVVIPDGGHDLGVEQPEAVAEAVAGFLPRVESAGTP